MTSFEYICKCIDKIPVEDPVYPRWSICIDDEWIFVPVGEEELLKTKIKEIQNNKEDYEEVSLYYEIDETANGLSFICNIVEEEESDEE